MSFDNLGLQEAITRAVRDAGYTQATDVQQHAIGPALSGTDLMVSARTGSGKTAAFILPALQRVLAARAATGNRRDRSAAASFVDRWSTSREGLRRLTELLMGKTTGI